MVRHNIVRALGRLSRRVSNYPCAAHTAAAVTANYVRCASCSKHRFFQRVLGSRFLARPFPGGATNFFGCRVRGAQLPCCMKSACNSAGSVNSCVVSCSGAGRVAIVLLTARITATIWKLLVFTQHQYQER